MEGDNVGKGRRVFRNNYKGHMDKTKAGRIRVGMWGSLESGESGGEKMKTTVLEQQKNN